MRAPKIGRLPRNSSEDLPLKFYQPQIYSLRVLKAYKGAMKLNRTVGFELHGVTKGRNVRVKLFTPSKLDSCRIKLRTGRIYLFGGQIAKKKLSLNRCSWISVWHKMSVRHKGKLLKYRRLCKCKKKKKCKNKLITKQKRNKLRKKRKHWNWKWLWTCKLCVLGKHGKFKGHVEIAWWKF